MLSLHNNNYYNTSPTYMYQHQQRFPQRMYEQVPSPPPQQQPYHPIHLNKELYEKIDKRDKNKIVMGIFKKCS